LYWQSNMLLQADTAAFFMSGFPLLHLVGSGSFGCGYRAADPTTGAASQKNGGIAWFGQAQTVSMVVAGSLGRYPTRWSWSERKAAKTTIGNLLTTPGTSSRLDGGVL
jgi:hypothetical protein